MDLILLNSIVGWKEFWLYQLFLNVLSYVTIIVPFYLLITWLKKTHYLKRAREYLF